MANDRKLIFDGKEKSIYASENPEEVIIHYKDTTTAYGGIKRAVFHGKGKVNNSISSLIFDRLKSEGVRTHYLKTLNDNEQLCRKVEIIPLHIVVRNRIAGSTAALLGVEEGMKPSNTVYELLYNNDDLADPLINDHHAVALGLVSYEELNAMYRVADKVNSVLSEMFGKIGIDLIDFRIEFGRTKDGEIIISDEISPDTARLWDAKTGDRLDKDRFRLDLGDVMTAYNEILDRLQK